MFTVPLLTKFKLLNIALDRCHQRYTEIGIQQVNTSLVVMFSKIIYASKEAASPVPTPGTESPLTCTELSGHWRLSF